MSQNNFKNKREVEIAFYNQSIKGFLEDNLENETDDCLFDLKEFCEQIDITPRAANLLICNLEDTDIMEQLSIGHYDNFQPSAKGDFNDSYLDVIDDVVKESYRNTIILFDIKENSLDHLFCASAYINHNDEKTTEFIGRDYKDLMKCANEHIKRFHQAFEILPFKQQDNEG